MTDSSIAARIADAACITPRDTVLEIGPGAGSLTVELAGRAGRVLAVEIDRSIIPALRENIKGCDNVKIINEDFLKLELADFLQREAAHAEKGTGEGKLVAAANLPYYITTPIIMKILGENSGVHTCVFMVQKEVAERIAAKPGGKDYGALSVIVRYYAEPEILFNVPPHCFTPQPGVDSTVIRLAVRRSPVVNVLDREVFFKTVKAAFGQRRKTLANALANSGYFIFNKEEIIETLKNIGIGEKQRGETLSIMQFADLANSLCPLTIKRLKN